MRRDFSIYDDIFKVTYLQFSKRYEPTNMAPKSNEAFKPGDFLRGNGDSYNDLRGFQKIDFIVTDDFENLTSLKLLPKYIKLSSVHPGEPKFMKLRSIRVARLHKFNQTKSPHEFYYSELQLYKPFVSEETLASDSLERCKAI